MAININPPSPGRPRPPQHNILVTIPRTASNLVTHLLALGAQSSIIAHPRDGYFFLSALSRRFKNASFTRPYESWSDIERNSLNDVLQEGIEAWSAFVAEADQKGKGTYVKEHVNWALKPRIESAFPPLSTLYLDSLIRQQTPPPFLMLFGPAYELPF
jgi:hypothetical protein